MDWIDSAILEGARHGKPTAAQQPTGLSRVSISRRIRRLVESGYLRRTGAGTRPTYTLGAKRFWQAVMPLGELVKAGGEEGVWEARVRPLFDGVAPNVANVARTGFTEITNNAIDHAQARYVCMSAHLHEARVQLAVLDDGVGVFRKIAHRLALFDDRLAILELAKGKYTTAPEGHSGMGVFVTSRLFDRFAIHSRGLVFSPGADLRFDWLDEVLYAEGTVVLMEIALDSARTVQQIYDRYFDPDGYAPEAFHTTVVPVRLAQLSSDLISRSQGKWVVARATEFSTVILDFEGVRMVGQAFVDQVFRVFRLAHPAVRLVPQNMSPEVEKYLRMFAPKGTLD